MEEEKVISMPRIGDKAPDFKANTTYGPIQFSEFNKGSWVVMFSHPADFTPVCTTEMSGFAVRHNEFRELNTNFWVKYRQYSCPRGMGKQCKEKYRCTFRFPDYCRYRHESVQTLRYASAQRK
jgi:hypothetical protein